MSSSMILSESLIESGRDIPLKELLLCKARVRQLHGGSKRHKPA